jgi:hypothetical protein
MIEADIPEFKRNMKLIEGAVMAASSRAVRTMALGKKDRTLASLAKYVDDPTPFTMRKSAYRATPPKMVGGDLVAEFIVPPLQAAYLW